MFFTQSCRWRRQWTLKVSYRLPYNASILGQKCCNKFRAFCKHSGETEIWSNSQIASTRRIKCWKYLSDKFSTDMVNKHHRLCDSKFGQEEVWVWSPTKKNRVEHKPCLAHGCVVNYQQAYFRRSQGAWNKITTHFTKILIIIALTRNNGCTIFNRWGIFVSVWGPFYLATYFLQAKT